MPCKLIWCLAFMGALLALSARAQEVLPTPPKPFKEQIGLSVQDSRSDFPQPVQAPKGAPNILLVLLDDVGFGAASAFGGPVSTPMCRTGSRARWDLSICGRPVLVSSTSTAS
jgi:hypothetical protein